MKTIFKLGLATFAVARLSLGGAAVASAESYDSPNFTAGSHEAYLIQHCTNNPCNIDYSTLPNWPSNPHYRHPSVRVYEYPGYSNEQYSPPPAPEEQSPYDEQ